MRPRRLTAGYSQDALALQAIEVFGEAAAVGAEVVPLHEEVEERVDFVVVVEDAEEVAGVALGGEDEEVADGGGEERGELLFGEEFCGGELVSR